jgi:uncharacterized protein (TIGR03435 family)
MVVEVIFWFHPMVWWIRTQLVAERERSCDESVVGIANDPQIYAEAILNVCKLYLETPLRCVSGVTGSNLKKRIRAIVSGRVGGKLTLARKAALAILVTAAIAAPILFGLANATPRRAQSQTQDATAIGSEYRYEVATIKPNKSGDAGTDPGTYAVDGFTATNVPLLMLVRQAYGLRAFAVDDGRVFGGPSWLNSERYNIDAKIDGAVAEKLRKLSPDQSKLARQHMLQVLLADRVNLMIHRETKELPIYSLVVAKNGPKLQESKPDDAYPNGFKGEGGRGGTGIMMGGSAIVGQAAHIDALVPLFSILVGRTVLDKTGLTGTYDFKLKWTPDQNPSAMSAGAADTQPAESSAPSLFTAIQEQLGLKLEAGKGPVEVIVIDHVERPSGN